MALPRTAPTSWLGGVDLPSRLFETGSNDYELYEEDDEFVLTVELPGFDPEEITASWNDGILNIGAEHEDASRNHRRTYHRRFRFPKAINEDELSAQYANGILEVRLPVTVGAEVAGREIEIES